MASISDLKTFDSLRKTSEGRSCSRVSLRAKIPDFKPSMFQVRAVCVFPGDASVVLTELSVTRSLNERGSGGPYHSVQAQAQGRQQTCPFPEVTQPQQFLGTVGPYWVQMLVLELFLFDLMKIYQTFVSMYQHLFLYH